MSDHEVWAKSRYFPGSLVSLFPERAIFGGGSREQKKNEMNFVRL